MSAKVYERGRSGAATVLRLVGDRRRFLVWEPAAAWVHEFGW